MATEAKTLDVVVPDQVWSVSHLIRMLAGVYLPARMTVVRLGPSRLALISPVPLDDRVAAAIDALGTVALIIAPNNYHHLYLRPAMERYPQAEVWAAPGLPKKRPNLRFTALLGPDAAPAWSRELTPVFLAGAPLMDETVFVHQATGTLIVTDSFFNLTGPTTGLLSPVVFRLTGSLGKPGQSRIWRNVVKDRAAMGATTRRVFEHAFDRLIMAHGDVIQQGGREAFEKATGWLYV